MLLFIVSFIVFFIVLCIIVGSKNKKHFSTVLSHKYGPQPLIFRALGRIYGLRLLHLYFVILMIFMYMNCMNIENI